ncbi:metallophosphoesterase [Sphingobium sp. EP60837]|jgi:serine/threonine protein phosphatase 1|uniref:metallophosphoesterase n=1 Tax=Sphingobium sp. EP60837 TaxID=1855519 RepID=UPI0007DD713F|nr:metallophosphoesterase [Sphingobium sp. EP60837]ANI76880.1 Protein-serine/threonine phosphatase [Sphingobium sp. EP60837]
MLKFLRRREAPRPLPSLGEDRRVYAVGDIHGRLDLFDQLLELIERDDARRHPLPCHLILLGDLVDRGPHSAQMVERAMALQDATEKVHFIKGNHEEVFVSAARGSSQYAGYCRRIGGVQTLASYGLDVGSSERMTDEDVASWMLNHVPRSHVDFLDRFEDMLTMGDYLFVHAGIRPGLPLQAQTAADLHWIRSEFLNHRGDHGYVVVHGHSITTKVDEKPNRVGIDTGAWSSGKLTAVGLQGTERWFLQT